MTSHREIIIPLHIWEEPLWIVLESFLSPFQSNQSSLLSNDNLKESFFMFLYCFKDILPSVPFRNKYNSFLSQNPIIPQAINDPQKWFHDLKSFLYPLFHDSITDIPFYTSSTLNDDIVSPKFWGNSLWTLIETILFSYNIDSPEVLHSVHMFLYSLQNLIPCPECKSHYQQFLSKYIFEGKLQDRIYMLRWCYLLKQQVYKRTHPNNNSFFSFQSYYSSLVSKYSSS